MPTITITAIEGRTAQQKACLLRTAGATLLEAFDIRDSGYTTFIKEYPVGCVDYPKDKDEQMLIVEALCFSGRTIEQKRNFYRLLTERFRSMGERPANVLIIIREEPLENWGICGGQSAADVIG